MVRCAVRQAGGRRVSGPFHSRRLAPSSAGCGALSQGEKSKPLSRPGEGGRRPGEGAWHQAERRRSVAQDGETSSAELDSSGIPR